MKIRIEVADGLPEEEVVIRCARVTERVKRIHEFLLKEQAATSKLVFYKDNQEFFFPLDEVLFFETDNELVFAHTAEDLYRTKYRLYELEERLPPVFVRASKSAIVNTAHIYSVTRNITSSSLVQFIGTHKHIYVSRHYYGGLRQRLNERSGYER